MQNDDFIDMRVRQAIGLYYAKHEKPTSLYNPIQITTFHYEHCSQFIHPTRPQAGNNHNK